MRQVHEARAGVLRDEDRSGPLLLRAALPARAVPLAPAHVLHRARALHAARQELRALRAPQGLLLPQEAS